MMIHGHSYLYFPSKIKGWVFTSDVYKSSGNRQNQITSSWRNSYSQEAFCHFSREGTWIFWPLQGKTCSVHSMFLLFHLLIFNLAYLYNNKFLYVLINRDLEHVCYVMAHFQQYTFLRMPT